MSSLNALIVTMWQGLSQYIQLTDEERGWGAEGTTAQSHPGAQATPGGRRWAWVVGVS